VWISEYFCDENDSNLTWFAAHGGKRKLSQGEVSSESNQNLRSSSNIFFFFVLDWLTSVTTKRCAEKKEKLAQVSSLP
jgi:hypothetical protein